MLEYLESNNLFILPLDDERRWYRYHHLFADLLLHRLQREQTKLEPELHRRASEWYEENGLIPEAVSHALASGDLERAADLIEWTAWTTLARGEIGILHGWLLLRTPPPPGVSVRFPSTVRFWSRRACPPVPPGKVHTLLAWDSFL